MGEFPKIDLHLHLDGAVRTRTALELAEQQAISLPVQTAAELRPLIQVSPDCRSLTDFLKTFSILGQILKTPEAIRRVARELMEDLAKDGVIYAEVRFAPILNIQDRKNSSLAMKEVVDACLAGMQEGLKSGDMEAGLILCCYRGEPLNFAHETVEIAGDLLSKKSSNSARVCGIDLAGDESRYPAGEFKEVFQKARTLGIPATVHGAEAAGPESARAALDLLGARRLGHGTRIIEDPDLLNRIINEETTLEICLTSNLQTGAVENLAQHPFREYLDRGVRVTLNTDDPRISNITLSSEWELAQKTFALNNSEIQMISENSLQGAFASAETKQKLTDKLHTYFQ